MKEYEDSLYQKWLETVDGSLVGLMKRSVLAKASPPPPPMGNEEEESVTATPSVSPTKGGPVAAPQASNASE